MKPLAVVSGKALPKRGRRGAVYPFATMKIGDQFVVEANGVAIGRVQTRICVAAHSFRKRTGSTKKFATRRNVTHNQVICGRVK